MVSILYQDFRDGLFELYIQSGRSYWSYCWCKCLFPVILTVISVLLNLAFMRVLSSGFQITAGADDAIGALIVSVLGTIVCSLGAMPMVYVSRNSDPTMAQLVLVFDCGPAPIGIYACDRQRDAAVPVLGWLCRIGSGRHRYFNRSILSIFYQHQYRAVTSTGFEAFGKVDFHDQHGGLCRFA